MGSSRFTNRRLEDLIQLERPNVSQMTQFLGPFLTEPTPVQSRHMIDTFVQVREWYLNDPGRANGDHSLIHLLSTVANVRDPNLFREGLAHDALENDVTTYESLEILLGRDCAQRVLKLNNVYGILLDDIKSELDALRGLLDASFNDKVNLDSINVTKDTPLMDVIKGVIESMKPRYQGNMYAPYLDGIGDVFPEATVEFGSYIVNGRSPFWAEALVLAYRKYIVGLNTPEILEIKLGDMLHNLKTIRNLKELQRQRVFAMKIPALLEQVIKVEVEYTADLRPNFYRLAFEVADEAYHQLEHSAKQLRGLDQKEVKGDLERTEEILANFKVNYLPFVGFMFTRYVTRLLQQKDDPLFIQNLKFELATQAGHTNSLNQRIEGGNAPLNYVLENLRRNIELLEILWTDGIVSTNSVGDLYRDLWQFTEDQQLGLKGMADSQKGVLGADRHSRVVEYLTSEVTQRLGRLKLHE